MENKSLQGGHFYNEAKIRNIARQANTIHDDNSRTSSSFIRFVQSCCSIQHYCTYSQGNQPFVLL